MKGNFLTFACWKVVKNGSNGLLEMEMERSRMKGNRINKSAFIYQRWNECASTYFLLMLVTFIAAWFLWMKYPWSFTFICVMDNILYHSNHQPPKISLPLHNAINSHLVTWKCDLQIVKIVIAIDRERWWNAVKRIIFLRYRILKEISGCWITKCRTRKRAHFFTNALSSPWNSYYFLLGSLQRSYSIVL